MGEVWRARDARLERNVAIKVLPAEFAGNSQLKLRFEREAKSISQLNHPHICTLHDVGHDSGIDYLVMEMIEGETLADRLKHGPLPLPEVLRFGTEIADALDRAHRAGIVHRDLKPANVMLTKSGTKLLDFGLAKSDSSVVSMDGATMQKPLTQEGTILGTFQYMAPEQLEGSEADARTDIFSFGALLYEMATGHRAFEGKTRTSLIAAIVGGEPKPIRSVMPLAPAALQHVIAKCLEKDPDERWQSAHDVAQELEWIGTQSEEAPRQRPRSLLFVIAALALLAIGASAAAVYFARNKPAVAALEVSIPPGDSGGVDFYSGPPAFSSDGKSIAYSGRGSNGHRSLWLRRLDGGKAQPISGTDEGTNPFWSPDGQKLGFFSRGKLKKVSVNGGEADELADADGTSGGSWSADGVILFARAPIGGLSRISVSGGEPLPATSSADVKYRSHRWPWFLPDGKHFLYLALPPGDGKPVVFVASLDPKEPARNIGFSTRNPAYASGMLLVVRDGILRAQKFDPVRLKAEEDSVSIAGVQSFGWNSAALYGVSQTGLLAYHSQGNIELSQLTRKARDGKTLMSVVPGYYWSPRLSHDGTKVAVDNSNTTTGDGDIWVFNTDGRNSTRLTFEAANETAPIWSSDDSAVTYMINHSRIAGKPMTKRLAGGAATAILPEGSGTRSATDWSSDGVLLALVAYDEAGVTGRDVLVYSMSDRKTVSVAATPADESGGQFSPDGKWIVYQSNETGRDEIYVQSFPPSGAKYQVSSDGGRMPRWRTQNEIFYLAPDGRLTTVGVDTTTSFRSATPQALFQANLRDGGFFTQYDVAADGTIVLNELVPHQAAPLTLLVNWTARLTGSKTE